MEFKKNNKTAFSLIELMIVVSITGILVATSLPAFTKYKEKAHTVEAYTLISSMLKAQTTYFLDEGYFLHIPGGLSPINLQGDVVENDYLKVLGYPYPLGSKLKFRYHNLAGQTDAGANEIIAAVPDSSPMARLYSFRGMGDLTVHDGLGGMTDCAESDLGDGIIDVTGKQSYSWYLLIASINFRNDDPDPDALNCTYMISVLDHFEGSFSQSPVIKASAED